MSHPRVEATRFYRLLENPVNAVNGITHFVLKSFQNIQQLSTEGTPWGRFKTRQEEILHIFGAEILVGRFVQEVHRDNIA